MNTNLLKQSLEQKRKKKERKKRILKSRAAQTFIILLIILGIVNFSELGFASANDNKQVKQVSVLSKKPITNKASEEYYNSNINMRKEHQKFLYKKCKEKNLDYKKVLALIETESGFDAKAVSSTNDYGYFQINKSNFKSLSTITKTDIDPFNPYINIEWGTHMLSYLYQYWGDRGINAKDLDHYVWSSYNKGITGFRKYGASTKYIQIIEENLKNKSN